MKVLRTIKEDSCIWLEETFAGATVATKWRPYTVGDLPNRFGCKDDGTDKG